MSLFVMPCLLLSHCLYLFSLQQGKFSQAETAIKKLYGKDRVAEVMLELKAVGQGSTEQDAGWFDLFSKRYRKGI